MSMTRFQVEQILRVRKGDPMTGRCEDGYGYALQSAPDDGYWIRLRGGIECVFVTDDQLQHAREANGHFRTSRSSGRNQSGERGSKRGSDVGETGSAKADQKEKRR